MLRSLVGGVVLAGFLLAALGSVACHRRHDPKPPAVPAAVQPAYRALAEGDYVKALALSQALAQGPAEVPGAPEALYLRGYAFLTGEGKFNEGRRALSTFVDRYPRHLLAPLAQKALADSFYWEGMPERALKEYGRLLNLAGDQGWGAYALYQSGNCMWSLRKDGDALSFYRSAGDKYPGDPMAEAALLRVAEVYRMLGDDTQARDEFQRLMKVAKDPAVRSLAMDELESIDHAAQPIPDERGGPSE